MDKKITTLIFDLGGVIIDLDKHATSHAFEKICLPQTKLEDIQVILDAYETGDFDEAIFYKKMKRHFLPNTTLNALIEAWNAMLLDIKVAHLAILEQLKDQYHIVILSNTNATHMRAFNRQLVNRLGTNNLEPKYCHKAFYSHLIHLAKPNNEIYEYVLKAMDKSAQTCLFIDDSEENIQAASSLGIHTIHLQKIDDLLERLQPFKPQ